MSMHKDKNGNYISIHTVVISSQGYVYSVEKFNPLMDNLVTLRNGCIVSHAKPEDLEVLIKL